MLNIILKLTAITKVELPVPYLAPRIVVVITHTQCIFFTINYCTSGLILENGYIHGNGYIFSHYIIRILHKKEGYVLHELLKGVLSISEIHVLAELKININQKEINYKV